MVVFLSPLTSANIQLLTNDSKLGTILCGCTGNRGTHLEIFQIRNTPRPGREKWGQGVVAPLPVV